MRKLHFLQDPDRRTPFCAANINYIRTGFDTTTDKEKVTCRLCMMRLGLIEDTRGNWDNRTR